jgi:transposase
MIKRVEKKLGQIASEHAGVQLLMTIPGVGIRSAEAVTAYIDDPHRFHRIKAIGRYFGMVPSQDASAHSNRLGHITREGPSTVRHFAVEAAWQAIRRSVRVRGFYERVLRGDAGRKKIAIVATAHYLLRTMLAMLQTGEVWRYAET